MTEFLLEVYVSPGDSGSAELDVARARAAAEQLTREGTPIRYVRSIFVPEEETCFHMYEAASPEAVRAAASLAALRPDHVVEAITEPRGA